MPGIGLPLCPAFQNLLSSFHFGHKGQQGHVPRALNRYGQSPLVLGAYTRLAAWANFAAITHKPA